ncbi:energy transducer TonB [Desulfoplanes sp.]
MKLAYNLTFWSLLLAAALLVNALMCMIAPVLSDNSARTQEELSTVPILLAPPPRMDERTKRATVKKPKPKPEKPVKTPAISLKQREPHRSKPKIRSKAPSFEVAMANPISPGMAVAPPPPDAVADFIQTGPPQTAKIGFELGELDTPPMPVRRVRPVYPFRARRQGITGKVTVRFLVNSTGLVEKISIVSSEPKGVFDQAVKDCITKWRFKPGIYQDKPVATWVVAPISFKL